jgi:release factor glutamine methyltransferase
LDLFRGFIKRRVKREPVAYIVGKKEFWSMELQVTQDVLIPRPETETLVEAALRIIPEKPMPAPWRVLDLGTGSGAILLAIASERPGHHFFGIDFSAQALAVARANAQQCDPDQNITWLQGDWFDVDVESLGSFNVVVSNPPYIPSHELERLAPEITQHEPRKALEGGADGLDAVRRIVREAPHHLVSGGWLFVEIGHDQGSAVRELIRQCEAYSAWEVLKDFGGLDRVVCARAA